MWSTIYLTNFFTLVYPTTRCRLKLLKMERIKDYLLMEEEFVQNQEQLKPQEEKAQVCIVIQYFNLISYFKYIFIYLF